MFVRPVVCRYRPEMAGDPLSDILRLANARSILTGGLRAGREWALRFRPPEHIKFLAISGGGGWLRMDGDAGFVRLEAGDVLLLADRRGFVLASDPKVRPLDAAALFAGRLGTIVPIDDDGEIQHIGGHVALDPDSGWVLSSLLPPRIHVGNASPQAPILRWLVDRLVQEGFAERPGADIAAAQIAQLLLVNILRAHIDDAAPLPKGALRAAADPHLSRALRLIHAEPGRVWRLAELARAAGLSRTVFTEQFRSAVGIPPIAYITRWRMLLADRALRDGGTPVGELARRLGYASESAFSQAFRRVMGASPNHGGRRSQARSIPSGFRGSFAPPE
jgi:AraC-like DNA-binding protein